METQNHTEREQQRRAWSEHILRGVEKKTPQVEFYIDDDGKPALSIDLRVQDHKIHMDMIPMEHSAWLTIGDINYISLETPEKTYMLWPNISDSWTDTTRWLVETVKPLAIAKKAVQQLLSRRYVTIHNETVTFTGVMRFLDKVWDTKKLVVTDDKIEFEAEEKDEFIALTYQFQPEGPTIFIEYENTRTRDELNVQLTPGFQLHEWVYEQLVSYTVRCDLYYRYRLETL